MLSPRYTELVELVLDELEHDKERRRLWNAVADVIDLVCDRPTSAEARHGRVDFPHVALVLWEVPVRTDDDWVVLWHQVYDEAVFEYIGAKL